MIIFFSKIKTKIFSTLFILTCTLSQGALSQTSQTAPFGFSITPESSKGLICRGNSSTSYQEVSKNFLEFCESQNLPETIFFWKRWNYSRADLIQNHLNNVMSNRRKFGLSGYGDFSCSPVENFINNFSADSKNQLCTVKLKDADKGNHTGELIYLNFFFFYPEVAKSKSLSTAIVVQGVDLSLINSRMVEIQKGLEKVKLGSVGP